MINREMLGKLNYILKSKQKIRLLQLFVLIIIGTVLELLGVSAILPFINVIMTPEVINRNALLFWIYNTFKIPSVHHMVIFLSMGLIAIYVIKNIYLALMHYAIYQFTYNNQHRMATQLMRCYMEQNYSFHVEKNSSELIRNITNDTTVFTAYLNAWLNFLTELLVCGVLFVYLLIKDKSIVIGIALLMLVFFVFLLKIYKKKMQKLGVESRICYAKVLKSIQEGFGGIKETKVLNREEFFINYFSRSNKGRIDVDKKTNILSMLPKYCLETLLIGGLLLVVSIKLYMGVDIEYFIPTISVFAVAAMRLLPSFNKIISYINDLSFKKSSVDALYDDLLEMEKILKCKDAETNGKEIFFEKGLEFKNVVFSYPENEKKILDCVNFIISPKSAVALVGASGGGKTTTADLILGILRPSAGEILVDGVNIWDNIDSWHNRLGYIPQSIYLMDDTLRRNIAFGIEDSEIDEDRIWKVLEEAQLKKYVENLEEGLNTIIGESGVRLSGGQRQRIGIARALYSDPAILVLDEATSALDNDTEKAVMESIDKLTGTRTLIIIAHRLETIRNCNVVYNIQGGAVTQIENPNGICGS